MNISSMKNIMRPWSGSVFQPFSKHACVHVVYFEPISPSVCTISKRKTIPKRTELLGCRKSIIMKGLGAHIPLTLPIISVTANGISVIWEPSTRKLKAISGPKSRNTLSRYNVLEESPEVTPPSSLLLLLYFCYSVCACAWFLSPMPRDLLFPTTCNTAALFGDHEKGKGKI